MTLTIRDLRPTRAAGDAALEAAAEVVEAQPYTTALVIEFDGVGEDILTIYLPHNPEGYDTEYSARWRARGAPGVTRDVSDFEGFDPAKRSFSWLGETDDPDRFEARVLGPLESAMQLINDDTQEAPRVQLLQGIHSMRGHIASLSVRRTRTDPRGNAIVAELSVTLIQNDPL